MSNKEEIRPKVVENGDEYIDDYTKKKIIELQSDDRLDKFTPEQQDILRKYIKLSFLMKEKAENVIYEGREMFDKSGKIDAFIETMLEYGEDNGEFQDIENLSGYATDICHINLYNWNGEEKMSDMILEFEQKASEWIYNEED